MAFQEFVNVGLHSKRTPWNASRDGTEDLDVFEFNDVITEAGARRLVDIPTVSANMDVYTKDDPVCWSNKPRAKVQFDELVRARKVLLPGADAHGTPARPPTGQIIAYIRS